MTISLFEIKQNQQQKKRVLYRTKLINTPNIDPCLVEFALELHPMQSQRVQEALHDIHATENAEGDDEPKHEHQ